MMARNVNSETGAEINVNSRESPLLLRHFRGVHRPAIRQTRHFRDENFRYRLLKWTALSVSTLFVVNIKACGITITANEEYTFTLVL
jgi:hypothetical protein